MDEKWLQSMKYYTKFRFVEFQALPVLIDFLDTLGNLSHSITWCWPILLSGLLSSNVFSLFKTHVLHIFLVSGTSHIIHVYS